ncbi:MAG: amidohydrolase family protein [Hyphomicrobiales bacterium]|nr:amidohydrolase family protein [Hyphomicrobiales bacterium]
MLVVSNARDGSGGTIDLVISEGTIRAIGPGGAKETSDDVPRFDAEGGIVCQPFVDGHLHLDKTLIGLPFFPHVEGETIAARIEAEKRIRRQASGPIQMRGGRLIEQIVARGTLALRSHVDVDSGIGLKGLESVLSLKESHGHLVDIQTVAFPQSGVMRDAGTADLLDAAIAAGADLVGGLDPAGVDNDIDGHLDAIFAIASKHGVGLDIHLHDAGALGAFELRQIATRTRALGLEGKVAVSHAFCLGELGDADFGRTAEALAEAGVAIMTTGPGPVPMPPVKRLKSIGVRVFCGSDNIRDAWSPFGNGDMLERAGIVCDRQNFRSDADLEEAFALTTEAPAAVLGRSNSLQVGARADFQILPASSIAEAVASRPMDRAVFRNGVMLARGGRLLQAGA